MTALLKKIAIGSPPTSARKPKHRAGLDIRRKSFTQNQSYRTAEKVRNRN